MKLYIIFCYTICGFGGAQVYIKNKVEFLRRNDYEVIVFSCIHKNIYFDTLKVFSNNIHSELKYLPSVFTGRNRDLFLNQIISEVDFGQDLCLVESGGGNESLWAELVAKKIGGKHICFNIKEAQNALYTSEWKEFFDFKFRRNELFTINEHYFQYLLSSPNLIGSLQNFTFVANCTNVVDETIEFSKELLDYGDYKIGGIWRTNKEGFVETFSEMMGFLQEYSNFTFGIYIIGSGNTENENVIREMYSKLKNVQVFFLGYQYPIPMNLITSMDVFVSTAGSSRIPMRYDVPSITVTTQYDSSTGKYTLVPIGILNYTTSSTIIPGENKCSLKDLLKMVLIDNYCKSNKKIGMNDAIFDHEEESKRQLDFFFKDSKNNHDYYPTEEIKNKTTRYILYRIIGNIFGANALLDLDEFGHRLKSKNIHSLKQEKIGKLK